MKDRNGCSLGIGESRPDEYHEILDYFPAKKKYNFNKTTSDLPGIY